MLVAGTTAWDTILRVPELPGPDTAERAHTIVDAPGGCGANTAYALALLGHDPDLLTAVGDDFGTFGIQGRLEGAGVNLEHIHHEPNAKTARAVLTTDAHDQQTIAYHEGATPRMDRLEPVASPIGHFAPGELTAYPRLMQACDVVTYDPGQETFYRPIEEVTKPLTHTDILLVNEHEGERIAEAYGGHVALLDEVDTLIVSDKHGQTIHHDGKETRVESITAQPVDLSGAGDAFNAGILHGLAHEWLLEDAARLGSVIAAFTIEAYGAQEGLPTLAEARERYEDAYDATLPTP